MKATRAVQKLVVDECHCYNISLNGIKHYCCKEMDKDCSCGIFKGERCWYFERAVLPMNPQLEALCRAELLKLNEEAKERIIERESPVAGKIKIQCKKCGKVFLADNYRQQYCKFCKKQIRRKNKREYMERKRSKIGISALQDR